MSDLDKNKRKTLKTLAGTSAAIATGSIGFSALANANNTSHSRFDNLNTSNGTSDLDITIIKSAPLGEIKVVVRNNTKHHFAISRFTGDPITLGKHHQFHLNRLLSHGPIMILPQESKHYSVLTIAIGHAPYQKHVWETSTTRIPGNIGSVIRVQGTLSDSGVVTIKNSPSTRPVFA